MTALLKPCTLACISAIALPTRLTEGPGALAHKVAVFADSDALLVSGGPYGHELYLVGGDLGAVDGTSLIRLLRRRTAAGILAWRARAPCAAWLDAGADIWLATSSREADLQASVRAVYRRCAQSSQSVIAAPVWRLDRSAGCLWTPGGTPISMSETDMRALSCFVGINALPVSHSALRERLGQSGENADNWLHATIYRLRRRIERGTSEGVPLTAQANVGYVFSAELTEF
jgi:two-component system OmpR family response regulator